MKHWLASVLLLLAPALQAATFGGTVSHVTDGDSLWVRPATGGEPLELRLLDLDAPEGCQVFGPQARQALRERVLGQPVRVRTRGTDDYGRQLARVEHRGEDVGRWLVRNGYAWSMRFQGRNGPYARLEAQARAERAGLWAMPGALDPRSFRKRYGHCQGRPSP
jgi:micrococcal nuclease